MLTKGLLLLLSLSTSCLSRPDVLEPGPAGLERGPVGLEPPSGGLEPGPEPGAGEIPLEKKPSKRQFFLSPLAPQPYPYIPIYVPYPQVVEVHHVVMLQGPACVPQPLPQPPTPNVTPTTPSPQPQPPITYPPPTTPTPGGIDDRSGMNTTGPAKPSRCVWAIVACCSPDSTNIRYSCFELLGCPGAFWGVNPCEPRVVQAAANTALTFYMSGGSDDVDTNNSLRK